MEWLARYWLLVTVLVAVATAFVTSSVYKALASSRKERVDELKSVMTEKNEEIERVRKENERLTKLNQMLRRDYKESLEFNFQDRRTIRSLAKETRELRMKLGLPYGDFLLDAYAEAEDALESRMLKAKVDDAHLTSSPELKDE